MQIPIYTTCVAMMKRAAPIQARGWAGLRPTLTNPRVGLRLTHRWAGLRPTVGLRPAPNLKLNLKPEAAARPPARGRRLLLLRNQWEKARKARSSALLKGFSVGRRTTPRPRWPWSSSMGVRPSWTRWPRSRPCPHPPSRGGSPLSSSAALRRRRRGHVLRPRRRALRASKRTRCGAPNWNWPTRAVTHDTRRRRRQWLADTSQAAGLAGRPTPAYWL